MATLLMAIYVLMWPIMSAAVLVLIWTTFMKELKEAKREGRSIV